MVFFSFRIFFSDNDETRVRIFIFSPPQWPKEKDKWTSNGLQNITQKNKDSNQIKSNQISFI
jgi:hypothetical protein